MNDCCVPFGKLKSFELFLWDEDVYIKLPNIDSYIWFNAYGLPAFDFRAFDAYSSYSKTCKVIMHDLWHTKWRRIGQPSLRILRKIELRMLRDVTKEVSRLIMRLPRERGFIDG